MKLRNKKTGEIVEITARIGEQFYLTDSIFPHSLAELNAEWEDVPEEPKSYYYITSIGEIVFRGFSLKKWNDGDERRKQIGNYFETKEEAEKAVEKLKAWKRLKDKGFRFTAWKNGILFDETVAGQVRYEFPIDNKNDIEKDLDLLFGGEE